MTDSSQSARDTLAQRGIRCTRQREVIYAALLASRAHPTAEELYQSVRAELPGISLATVYNTLESLNRSGLCRRLAPVAGSGAGGAACRFDGNVESHVHLIDGGGRICDVPSDLGERVLATIPPALIREVEERLGIQIERISVDFLAGCEPSEARSAALAGGQISHSPSL